MPRFRLDILDMTLREAGNLHAKVADARSELEDFYKVSAESLKIKPQVLKKLVKRVMLGEEDSDPEIDLLLAEIEKQRQDG
jgi:hypothetical protein